MLRCLIFNFSFSKFTFCKINFIKKFFLNFILVNIFKRLGKMYMKKKNLSTDLSNAKIDSTNLLLRKKTFEFRQTDWNTIYLSALISFLSAIQFSLYFSSLWPFLITVSFNFKIFFWCSVFDYDEMYGEWESKFKIFGFFLFILYIFFFQLNPDTDEFFFGLIIGSYSLAQIITAPLMGWWSHVIGRIRPALLACSLAQFFGNFLYFFAELISFNPSYTLLFARFITGTGGS